MTAYILPGMPARRVDYRQNWVNGALRLNVRSPPSSPDDSASQREVGPTRRRTAITHPDHSCENDDRRWHVVAPASHAECDGHPDESKETCERPPLVPVEVRPAWTNPARQSAHPRPSTTRDGENNASNGEPEGSNREGFYGQQSARTGPQPRCRSAGMPIPTVAAVRMRHGGPATSSRAPPRPEPRC